LYRQTKPTAPTLHVLTPVQESVAGLEEELAREIVEPHGAPPFGVIVNVNGSGGETVVNQIVSRGRRNRAPVAKRRCRGKPGQNL